MKSTVVPAQITTVEDKVAGSLSFTQLLLLITPVFIGGGIFVILPPVFGFSYFKLLICSVLAFVCTTLAIRIKGKILLQWIIVLTRYVSRPRYYLFNKNDLYLRQIKVKQEIEEQNETMRIVETEDSLAPVSMHPSQLVRVEAAIADPNSKFHLRSEKGVLRAYITEIKKENV